LNPAEPDQDKPRGALRQIMIARPKWDPTLAVPIRSLAGVVAVCCLVMSTTNGALSLGPIPVVINLIIPIIVLIAVVYIESTLRFQGPYFGLIVLVFLVLFPVGFFTSGGAQGVMPYYFLTGMALTSFMMQGWRFAAVILLEFAVFSYCLWLALFNPASVTPAPDHRGLEIAQPIGFMCAAVVISLSVQVVYYHYVRTADQLNRSNQALRDAARNKDAFLALVAHELKTPVAIMSSHAQEAARVLDAIPYRGGEFDRVRNDMATILRQSTSLSGMVTQLLDINRINEGRLALNISRISLTQVVQNTLAECALLFGSSGNQLRLAPGGAHPVVMGDPNRLNRALLNLISNAARHTENGTITIAITKEEGFARVSVTDNGEGMTQAQIENIFRAAPGSPTPPYDAAASSPSTTTPHAGLELGVGPGGTGAGAGVGAEPNGSGADAGGIGAGAGAGAAAGPNGIGAGAGAGPAGIGAGAGVGPAGIGAGAGAGAGVGAGAGPSGIGAGAGPNGIGAGAGLGQDGPGPGPEGEHHPLPIAVGSRHGGLGLGLRIVRHTVATHGGQFEIVSELGRGTTTSFTIPLAPPAR
jgi:signal transduction histidine kinase